MEWWLGEFSAEDQAEKYLELFPEMNDRLWKYAVGIHIWAMEGDINLNNPDDISRVRTILKVIGSTPAFDFFDNVFNECNPDTVCEILGMSPKVPRKEAPLIKDYTVFQIDSWEEAKTWSDIVSWCILISEEAFKMYTRNGNRFCFCGNGEYWDTPCEPGINFPYDQYGHSLIAVEISPENEIVSVTSRWNTCAADVKGHYLTPEQLCSLLGDENYAKLFVHKSEN